MNIQIPMHLRKHYIDAKHRPNYVCSPGLDTHIQYRYLLLTVMQLYSLYVAYWLQTFDTRQINYTKYFMLIF